MLRRNNTRRSYNDPDRIFINSTTFLKEFPFIHQPPWYVGNTNKIKPVDESHYISAQRYGFRGSKGIQQFTTAPWDLPSRTRTENTPKFLNNDDNYVNEWVPPIVAATHRTINNMESPKLWPVNTRYPTGYQHKELPETNNWVYKRETTIDLPEPPKSPETLSLLMSKTVESNQQIKSLARQESMKNFLSLPMAAQEEFTKTWDDRVKEKATGVLKYIMRRPHPTYQPHTLMDPSDTIKYSGSTAMIVHTQNSDELKFRLRMERSRARAKTPFQVKWQHVIAHFHAIQKKLTRGQSMHDVIRSIAKTLRDAALRSGSETSLRRIDFIKACQSMPCFTDTTAKQLSVLYSLFDPMKKDSMRFVELLGLMTILDNPTDLPYDKVRALWKLHNEFGLDRNVFDIVFEVLSCCAYSLKEYELIEKLFRDEFTAKSYEAAMGMQPEPSEVSVHSSSSSTRIQAAELKQIVSKDKQSPAKGKNSSFLKTGGDEGDNRVVNGDSPSGLDPSNDKDSRSSEPDSEDSQKKSLSVQPQYNICNYYLSEDSIVHVLHLCPNLVVEFDDQLHHKILLCYGKDDRYVEVIADSTTVTTQDFSWIMKAKQGPKKTREVFGLF